jgi:hypothetical protein
MNDDIAAGFVDGTIEHSDDPKRIRILEAWSA